MKRSAHGIAHAFYSLAAVGLILSAGCPPAKAQTIPSDPEVTCSVSTTEFNSWFQAGSPSLNGVVNPANSVTFPDTPNCSFYKWSEQMFLWLTSPAPPMYGSGGRIFDSPGFFDVSPPEPNAPSNANRTFIPHTPGKFRVFNLRQAQLGPNKLPIIFDKSGRMLEIERPQVVASAKLSVIDRAGKMAEIETARRGENGRPIFLDQAGKVIEPRTLAEAPGMLLTPPGRALRVQKFEINKIPIFLDLFGNIVDVEQGQADGEVLEAQNGSLIYYATMVNDVYAYFLTGAKDSQIVPGTQFPTTQTELNAITTFASGHGKTFVDPSALAVEIKTSWVEAASLSNPSDYITMIAIVPTYDQSNPNLWVPNGQKTIQLALVGMHVVGSTNGHPEMIWATFEHLGNAPNGPYSYVNVHGQIISVPQATVGTWLFTASNSVGPFNLAHMQQPFGSPNIVSISPDTISPSNTIRWKAWGAGSDVSPNPIDGSSARSNSEIIAINNSVRGQLVSGDVRGNYIMTGATWTIGGAAPNNNQVGTSMLSNTTMETYQQGQDNTKAHGGSNCFSCHDTNTTEVSHVFPGLNPLF